MQNKIITLLCAAIAIPSFTFGCQTNQNASEAVLEIAQAMLNLSKTPAQLAALQKEAAIAKACSVAVELANKQHEARKNPTTRKAHKKNGSGKKGTRARAPKHKTVSWCSATMVQQPPTVGCPPYPGRIPGFTQVFPPPVAVLPFTQVSASSYGLTIHGQQQTVVTTQPDTTPQTTVAEQQPMPPHHEEPYVPCMNVQPIEGMGFGDLRWTPNL